MSLSSHDAERSAYVRDNGGSHREPIVETDMAEELDTLADQWMEECRALNLNWAESIKYCATKHERLIEVESAKVKARAIAQVVGGLMLKDNVQLQMRGLCFAAGLDVAQGVSMTEVAVQLGCSRANISKATVWWSDFLGLPRSRYMKSKEAGETYSRIQSGDRHWRKQIKAFPKSSEPQET